MCAGLASKHGAVPVPGRTVPAVETGAPGVVGLYREDDSTGALSLVRDHREEGSPPGVVDVAVQDGLRAGTVGRIAPGAVGSGCGSARQVGDVEVFVDDQVVVVHRES